jgi:outer membrane receptor protein involved in Fe transport
MKFFGVFSTINSVDTDTSSNRYNWLGDVMRVAEDNTGEIMNQKTIFEYDQTTVTYRANIKYRLYENHNLSANYIGYQVKRQGENRLGVPEEEPFRSPNTLMKNVLGVSYDADLINNKLNISMAAKYYHFNISTKNAKQERDFTIVIEDEQINQNLMGYYLGARYFITSDLYVKSSYEKGYRLPEPDEIFGDGLNRYANPLLSPETSDNFNLGINFNRQIRKQKVVSQANFFLRDVADYMQPVRFRRGSRVENILNVLVYGFELDLQYEWDSRLLITANLTQQNVLNNEKYDDAGNIKRIYRDQLPNTPYFFWNLGANYDVRRQNDGFGLAVYYSLNYVHEFFLGYESVATGGEKNTIPTQILNNVGATITSHNKKYSVSIECANVFNALAFDNFNIQKPGRALYAKLRCNINNQSKIKIE